MGKLLIKNINKENIDIIQYNHTYKIIYKLPYISLLGISLTISNIHIREYNEGYSIIIKDKTCIDVIKNTEYHISKNIHNYSSMLKHNRVDYYINFRKNPTISTNITKYIHSSSMPINIFKIKKHASHSHPIVYIL